MISPNNGPWWVPASRNGKANFITRANAILLAFVAGLVGTNVDCPSHHHRYYDAAPQLLGVLYNFIPSLEL